MSGHVISSYSKLMLMSAFLYTLLGLTVGSSLQPCSVRQQISPCTCYTNPQAQKGLTTVECEGMNSFAEVQRALKGQFAPQSRFKLMITHSQLEDLVAGGGGGTQEEDQKAGVMVGFGDLNYDISHLNISDNNLTTLRKEAFSSLGGLNGLNADDNLLTQVPAAALLHKDKLKTVSLAGNQITAIRAHDFWVDSTREKVNSPIENLVLADNLIGEIAPGSLPRRLLKVTLARNRLVDLNGALRHLHDLEWLWLGQNHVESLDGELPTGGSKLVLLNVSHNALTSLPSDLAAQTHLEDLYVDHNKIRSLGGALQRSKRLNTFSATYNQITALNEDEFTEAESLNGLFLAHNQLGELNGALRPLRGLVRLSLHHNALTDFDLAEVRGLRRLSEIDLRYNSIERLVSKPEDQNAVELETSVVNNLRLGHNRLKELNNFLSGLPGLGTLDLSHNDLESLSPLELVGLDKLQFIDLSYNKLTSLANTATKMLPALETLRAGHNQLRTLERDLHGMPKLCVADLQDNLITSISPEVAARSTCTVKGVPSTLRIYLRGNDLKCESGLALAQEQTDSKSAELMDVADCSAYLASLQAPIQPTPPPLPTTTAPPSLPIILEVLKMASEVPNSRAIVEEEDESRSTPLESVMPAIPPASVEEAMLMAAQVQEQQQETTEEDIDNNMSAMVQELDRDVVAAIADEQLAEK